MALPALDIQFDYRFDRGFFTKHPDRKFTLEAAGKLWSKLLKDEFAAVPAGHRVQIWDYTTEKYVEVTINHKIKGLLIFVQAYSYELGGKAFAGAMTGSITVGGDLYKRYYEIPFQPWLGKLVFNTNVSRPWWFDQTPDTSDDVPMQTHFDFFSTCLHEIGHILGFTTGYKARKGNFFYGKKVQELLGRPLQFENESGHLHVTARALLNRPHIEETLMGAHETLTGMRYPPTTIDLAFLEDIGYHPNYANIPRMYDDPTPNYARRKKYLSENSDYKNTKIYPVGLWSFESASDINNAVLGYPPKYVPGKVPVKHVFDKGGTLVPAGSWWAMDHPIIPQKGESYVNTYSLLWDVLLPVADSWYSLLDTGKTPSGDAEVYINKSGALGKSSYSEKIIPANKWTRVVVTVDAKKGKRTFYIDGKPVLQTDLGKLDGQYSLAEWFLCFAEANRYTSDLYVKRIALFSYALSPKTIEKLATANHTIDKYTLR